MSAWSRATDTHTHTRARTRIDQQTFAIQVGEIFTSNSIKASNKITINIYTNMGASERERESASASEVHVMQNKARPLLAITYHLSLFPPIEETRKLYVELRAEGQHNAKKTNRYRTTVCDCVLWRDAHNYKFVTTKKHVPAKGELLYAGSFRCSVVLCWRRFHALADGSTGGLTNLVSVELCKIR